jgi:glutathione S-transferase
MKLHWSPRSPFVRKVMIVAHEFGLADRIACVRSVVAFTEPHAILMTENPLSKIPTLVLDDGTVLYDSPVICEYLDSLHDGPKLFPSDAGARMTALRRQALGDGFLDFLLLWRNERERAQPSEAHLAFSIGHVAVGCALSYLDFRFAADDWRGGYPRAAAWHAKFAARTSVRATEPVDDL